MAGQINEKERGIIFGDELLDMDIPEKEWIVEGIIPKGGFTAIIAPPKSAKSFLALGLASSISKGVNFLGLKTMKGKTLYLDEENGSQETKRRLKLFKNGLGLTKEETHNIGFLIYKGIKINNLIKEKIEEVIKEDKFDVIIIDSLVRFLEGEENSSKDMKVLFDTLKEFIEKYNTTFIILHHTRKTNDWKSANDARGSGDLIAQCSSVLVINTKGKYYFLELDCIRSSPKNFNKIKFELEDNTLGGLDSISLKLVENMAVMDDKSASELAAMGIKKYLEDNPEIKTFKSGILKEHFLNTHKNNAMVSGLQLLSQEGKIKCLSKKGGRWEVVKTV